MPVEPSPDEVVPPVGLCGRRYVPLHVVTPSSAERHLAHALSRVEAANPGRTSRRLVDRRQLRWAAVLVALTGLLLVLWPVEVLASFTTSCTVAYLVTIVHRLSLVRRSLRHDPSFVVTDADARAVADGDLPTYTVLVPAFGEPEVIEAVIGALERLDYPRDRLDVKLLLELDDLPTVGAALSASSTLPVEVLLVPEGEPRTKPRALNYGMEFARGDLVTVYDAEDHPDPLQLRRAVVAFERAGRDHACLQARLSFYGGERNLLTKWFTNDYFTWFRLYLPGLVSTGAPVPLGGTSNHFRRPALEEVGCWDPWNVTEDADLGVRLQRRGHRIGVLDSVTMEEPNLDVINWMKQRSRWYKGYLQTALVAARHPRELVRDLGWSGSTRLALFVGGTPLLALLSLFFWSMSLLWLLTRTGLIGELFPGWTYYLALAAWGVGNVAVLYISVLTLRVVGRPELLGAALLVPVYWLLMSLAAVRAVIQLVADPSHWEKTRHGLFEPR